MNNNPNLYKGKPLRWIRDYVMFMSVICLGCFGLVAILKAIGVGTFLTLGLIVLLSIHGLVNNLG